MLRSLALAALVALAIPATASAQTLQAAKPGESCQGYYDGCDKWCAGNRNDTMSCQQTCSAQLKQCLADGTWPLKQGTIKVHGLPATKGGTAVSK